MRADGQSKKVYLILDKVELEFVYQYRTVQYNIRKAIFKNYALCDGVVRKMNIDIGEDRYKVYELILT